MVHSYTKVWEVISKSDLKSEVAGVLLSKKKFAFISKWGLHMTNDTWREDLLCLLTILSISFIDCCFNVTKGFKIRNSMCNWPLIKPSVKVWWVY